MNTQSEENYLKAIYSLQNSNNEMVSTNALADKMQTKASSVTDMVKKLSSKKLVEYIKYQGVQLTENGKTIALNVIRKHRLWECFLVDKLNFSWDEVHEVAEQLEHIKSDRLINNIDDFLGNPTHDPHGDPIPNKNGEFQLRDKIALSEMEVNHRGKFVAVRDSSDVFLKYLNNKELAIGDLIIIKEIEAYDNSVLIKTNNNEFLISSEVADNLFVTKDK